MILGLLIAVLIVLALVDWQHNSFWSRHVFFTGLCTGFATLAVTIFGINDLMERRASRRWRFVADVAYRGLARESRDVSVAFALLYCDLDHPLEAGYSDPNFQRDRLTPLGEIRRTLPGKDTVTAFGDSRIPALPDDVGVRLPEKRIRFLLTDQSWVSLSHQEVARLVDVNRETVAKWATLLMNSKESREELNRYSSLNDGIFRLAYELQRFSVDRQECRIQTIWSLLVINDCKARVLTNHLWKMAGEDYRLLLCEPHTMLNVEDVFAKEDQLLNGY